MTIQMKAIEQYFPVVLVLFTTPYEVVLTVDHCTKWFKLLSLTMKSLSVTPQVKATGKCFPVVWSISTNVRSL